MVLKFDPQWLNWDVDVKEISKLETKEKDGTLAGGGVNKLAGLRELRKKRAGEAIFLTFFNQTNVQAAIWRATTRFKSSEAANRLLLDTLETSQTVTIKQGTHQPEDAIGGGYMLHFDAHSSRLGKCFHLYVGQLPSGSVTINAIAFLPSNGPRELALPDTPE